MSRWFRSLLLIVVLSPLIAGNPAGAQDGRLGKIEPESYDLGAMMLTSEDLADEGLEGYGIQAGWTDTLDDELIDIIGQSLDLSPDELESLYEDSGFQYARVALHDLPSEEDSALSARRVTSWINLHDGSGALEELVDTLVAVGDPQDGTGTIGDYSRISVFQENDPTTDIDSTVMMLGFAYETFTAFIQISDYVTLLPDEDPTIDEVEALGERLIDRIDDVLEDGAPGLDMIPLRMESDGQLSLITEDAYYHLDGETQATYREDPDQVESRHEEYEDWEVVAAYALDETFFGDDGLQIWWSVRLRLHESEADAEAWQADEPERSLAWFEHEDLDSEELSDIGDAAVLATYTQTFNGLKATAVFFRSGEITAGVYMFTPDDYFDEDVVIDLAEQQLECIEAGGCLSEVPIPDEILEYVEG